MKKKPAKRKTKWFGWHFCDDTETLRYGDGRKIKVGITHKVACTPKLCEQGLHASKSVLDALQYAPGNILYRVSLSGKIVHGDDKSAATERRYITRIDAEHILREFARKCALKVVHLWDCPRIVKDYLETGDEKLWAAAGAAWAAAGAAARDAAVAAAGAAARDADGDAAGDAAWDAAVAAARAADGAAAVAAAVAAVGAAAGVAAGAADGDAAWTAAVAAAWAADGAAAVAAAGAADGAAWAAAGAAARDAARDAAVAAAVAAQKTLLEKMVLDAIKKQKKPKRRSTTGQR